MSLVKVYVCCLVFSLTAVVITAQSGNRLKSRSHTSIILIFTIDFVCYYDESCADNDTRPIFMLASSATDCCGMPNVVAAWDVTTERCSHCGEYLGSNV